MARILVVGEFDSDNMGDALIGASHEHVLRQLGHDPVIRALEPDRIVAPARQASWLANPLKRVHQAAYSRFIDYRHAQDARQLERERRAYQDYVDAILSNVDLVLIGGGQLLFDDSLRMLTRLSQIARTARHRSVPVAACATGARPPRSKAARRLFEEIFANLSSFSAFRDERSRTVALQFSGADCPGTAVCPDAAIPLARHLGRGTRNSTDVVGLAPISPVVRRLDRATTALQRRWWIDLGRELDRRGKTLEFFSTGTFADQHFCEGLASDLQARGIAARVAPRPTSAGEFVGLASSCGSALTQRMHASVVRFASGQAPLSLPWDLKLHSFFLERGIEDRLLTAEFPAVTDVADKLAESADCSASAEEAVRQVVETTRQIVSEGLTGSAKTVS